MLATNRLSFFILDSLALEDPPNGPFPAERLHFRDPRPKRRYSQEMCVIAQGESRNPELFQAERVLECQKEYKRDPPSPPS
jgi:hypothetical protein